MSQQHSRTVTPILDGVTAHIARELIVGYTPGHKSGRAMLEKFHAEYTVNPLGFDLGFMGPLDDLHSPKGIIAEAEAEMARLYGAQQSFFLANGSTCGLMALLLAELGPGQTVIVPRNVHRAVLHGMILSGAIPRFVDPGFDPNTGLPLPLAPQSIDGSLMDGVSAIFPVSPTYHGLIADTAGLAQHARNHGAWIFVDEAHGAHLPFVGLGQLSGLAAGAHAVVQSAHKTLQAFTPGALLHVAQDGPDTDRLRAALRITQSSSANYALLASLDSTQAFMATEGPLRLAETIRGLTALRDRLNESEVIRAPVPERPLPPGVAAIDPTKLFIDVTRAGLSGFEAARRLYETAGIGVELATERGVLMIMTAADTPKDLERLGDRLLAFAASLPRAVPSANFRTGSLPKIAGVCAASPRDAFFAATERIAFTNSQGRIAAEPIVPYPPGVASLWPGERIAGDPAAFREHIRNSGASVQASDPSLATVLVLR